MQTTIEAEVIEGKLAKFQKLNQMFEIAEDTLDSMEEEFEVPAPVLYEEESDELISLNMLKSDLKLIRETLMSNVTKGRAIIDTVTTELISTGAVDAKLIDSLANLMKATNSSLKEMSSIFKELHDIEKEKKVKPSSITPEAGTTNIQNNVFVGTAAELMNMISGNR